MIENSCCDISGDHWVGSANHEWRVDSPSSDDLERALNRLNAKEYTSLCIEGDGERHMMVGGGGSKYVVYATLDNEEFWNLIAVEAKEGVVSLNAGGQEGDYPANQIVDLKQALHACLAFLATQELDADLKWEQQR